MFRSLFMASTTSFLAPAERVCDTVRSGVGRRRGSGAAGGATTARGAHNTCRVPAVVSVLCCACRLASRRDGGVRPCRGASFGSAVGTSRWASIFYNLVFFLKKVHNWTLRKLNRKTRKPIGRGIGCVRILPGSLRQNNAAVTLL